MDVLGGHNTCMTALGGAIFQLTYMYAIVVYHLEFSLCADVSLLEVLNGMVLSWWVIGRIHSRMPTYLDP